MQYYDSVSVCLSFQPQQLQQLRVILQVSNGCCDDLFFRTGQLCILHPASSAATLSPPPSRATNLPRMRSKPVPELHCKPTRLPQRPRSKIEAVAILCVTGKREHRAGDTQELDSVLLVPAYHLPEVTRILETE